MGLLFPDSVELLVPDSVGLLVPDSVGLLVPDSVGLLVCAVCELCQRAVSGSKTELVRIELLLLVIHVTNDCELVICQASYICSKSLLSAASKIKLSANFNSDLLHNNIMK